MSEFETTYPEVAAEFDVVAAEYVSRHGAACLAAEVDGGGGWAVGSDELEDEAYSDERYATRQEAEAAVQRVLSVDGCLLMAAAVYDSDRAARWSSATVTS